ncbi:restriction endonuclease subunit S [Mycolicibacterium goodii]|uniref:restriction endonuclease subunit S n=1 Tax=Mycolicibacterium goodii TaxID=134601 RepID=UPI001054BA54|nr:restriction endonuclease subunit S [Mycolicibacterium goodii]
MTAASTWTPRRMGELVTLTSGQSPSGFKFGGVGTPYYKVDQLGRSRKYLGRNSTPYFSTNLPQVPAGSVLIAKRGGAIALNRVRLTTLPSFMDTNVMALVPGDEVDSEYLYYWLDFRGLWDIADVTSVPQINNKHINPLVIELPELVEQQKIAGALRDADDLIAVLERLIAKKQAIKQGMMQQLFAASEKGQHRAVLGDIVSMLSGGTPNRSNDEYWSGNIPWVSASTLKSLEVATSDQAVTPQAVRAGSKMAPLLSTLILVRGSALHSEIRASLVTASVCFNQDVKALVPKVGLEPKFLTYSIHANASRLLSLVTSAGNTAGVLDTKVLKNFEIWVPSRERQRAVVSTFDDVTSEIDLLIARLEKARAIKTGMMQQLLTGRTRLPVEVSA